MGGTAVPNGYLPIGERIRHRRRARGLSQLRLAGLVDRTEDWVSKVERGEIPVDRISVLVRVADALKVPLSDLLGEQNWSEEQTASPQETAGLRRVLSTLPGTARAVPRAVSELEADLLSATRLRALVRYNEHDLAWVAADRGIYAAEPTGDPIERALSAYRLAHAFVGAGRLIEAVYLVESALERAAVSRRDSADLRALCGALHLPLAVAQARKGDQARAQEALREAEGLSRGPDGRFQM